MKTAYVVVAHGGWYEDAWERPVVVVTDIQMAEYVRDNLDEKADRYRERLERIIERRTDQGKETIDFDVALSEATLWHDIVSVELVEDWSGCEKFINEN